MNLKFYRRKAGMTQADLADCLDVTPQSICRWETGRREPSFRVLKKITKLLNVTMNDLFTAVN